MFARRGEITAPWGVPRSTVSRRPSSSTPAFSHLPIRRSMRLSPIRCSRNRISHSWLMLSKLVLGQAKPDPWECPDVGIQDPVDPPPVDPDHERIQRLVLAAPRPEAVGETEEVRLVDGVQHLHYRALDDLVLQRGDAERPLPAVRLGDVLPPGRLRPVGAPLYASMQIREVGLEVRLVLVPGDAVDARCGFALQLVKRKAQQVDVHMVQERRQPDLLIPPCGATYAVHCLGYACPALGLVRAAPDRIALGPAPSLHRLRSRKRGLVRRLHRYYERVRLPPAVHHRIGAFRLADADRAGGRARAARRWISRFPCRWLPRVQEVSRCRRPLASAASPSSFRRAASCNTRPRPC